MPHATAADFGLVSTKLLLEVGVLRANISWKWKMSEGCPLGVTPPEGIRNSVVRIFSNYKGMKAANVCNANE